MYKYLGLLIVLVTWVLGYYLLRTWHGDHTMSISQRGASSKESMTLLGVTLIACGVPFYVWIVTWLVPLLNLSTLFKELLGIALVAQIVAAIIPDTNGWRMWLHRIVAYGMAILYFPLSYLIVFSDSISPVAQTIGILCMLYMVISLLLALTSKWARQYYLVFQSLYIVAFQLVILSAAYLT